MVSEVVFGCLHTPDKSHAYPYVSKRMTLSLSVFTEESVLWDKGANILM